MVAGGSVIPLLTIANEDLFQIARKLIKAQWSQEVIVALIAIGNCYARGEPSQWSEAVELAKLGLCGPSKSAQFLFNVLELHKEGLIPSKPLETLLAL